MPCGYADGSGMKALSLIAAILIAVTCCGCASRNYYEGLRLRQDMDCRGLRGADGDECARKSGMSYDEYQRQLKEREQKK
jgi:hypothetical protein